MSLIICPICTGDVVFCMICDAYYCNSCKTFFDEVDNELKERYNENEEEEND
jgi:hypothetical protein